MPPLPGFVVREFGGEIPRKSPRELPPTSSEACWNADLSSGGLGGLPIPQAIVDLSSHAGVQRAYRFPGPNAGDADAWLALPSVHSSVVRSPLANDTLHRLYWTNPAGVGADGAWWSTYARIAAGGTGANAPYNLGFTGPDLTSTITVTATGGTAPGVVPYVVRSYLYTFIDQYGLESSPSNPSATLAGASDGTWTVFGLPTTAPASPRGKNYPTVIGMWLYRTIAGATAGATFYRVAFFNFSSSPPAGGHYTDATLDTVVVNAPQLDSTSFLSPPDKLDGLTAMPGGMLVGFTGNTVHFCEPDRPHAWPAAYDLSLQYNIVGFGVWQGSLIVMTEGYPASGAGSNPAGFAFTEIHVPEPCIARGSIIVDLTGVYYASQNGLVQLNYYGMTNQTLASLTKNIWLTRFRAANIIACRHRAQFLAINGLGTGFLIDYGEPRLGITELNTFSNAGCIWNDVYTGNTYIMAAGIVYLWDSPTAGTLVYRWRSKQFFLPAATNFGACQIELGPEVTDPPPVGVTIPLDNADAALVLPTGANAVFRLLVERNGVMTQIWEKVLDNARMIFRLPSGFKELTWQFELVSRATVNSVELARTMKELRDV